jgi:hypothetical protein
MTMSRLVCFVEGEGDRTAVPLLFKRILSDLSLWNPARFFLDEVNSRVVGDLSCLSGKHTDRWRKYLLAATKQPGTSGILVVLDGDIKLPGKQQFCAYEAARELSDAARQVGAGESFSLATVVATMEYESWLIAGIESLYRQRGVPGNPNAVVPQDIEAAPRDAKGWLRGALRGYSPIRDQTELTASVDLNEIRSRQLRSFRRLENAARQLSEALSLGRHICTPSP